MVQLSTFSLSVYWLTERPEEKLDLKDGFRWSEGCLKSRHGRNIRKYASKRSSQVAQGKLNQ